MRRVLLRNWFPLALLGVLILAVPGLVLCVLDLAGQADEANSWLEETFALSFHPALPPALRITVLVLPLVLVALYFLKLKRKPLQVPSTFLWKKSIEDLHVNSLMQWLRRNILLVLQLLILVAMIYAVMGIRFHASAGRGQFYILIIDNSASMNATDLGMTRLDWAKREAIKLIDSKGDDDWGMVIAFNSGASLVKGYTQDRAELKAAVARIEPSNRLSRIDDAILLAEGQANPVRAIENVAAQPENVPPDQERDVVQARGFVADVHLFSDGRFAPISESLLSRLSAREAGSTSPLGNLHLRYHRAGKAGPEQVNNLGIVELTADRADLGETDRLAPQRLHVLARVRNFRATPVAAAAGVALKLDLYVDGALARPMQRPVTIEARQTAGAREGTEARDRPGEATLDFVLPPLDLGRHITLRAYLAGHRDDFALDDEAWVVVGAPRRARIILIGPGNAVLEAFFRQDGLTQIASVEQMEPAALGSDRYLELARSGQADLFIFDRCTPRDESEMPLGNTLFIDRPPPPWLRSRKTLSGAVLVSDRKHPLLKNVTTLGDVGVADAFAFDLKDDLPEKARTGFGGEGSKSRPWPTPRVVLETSGNAPLAFTLTRGPFVDLVLAFPLVNETGDWLSNWPLQPSFPVFLSNVLYQLGNVDRSVRSPSSHAGEPRELRPEASVRRLTVTPPRGAPIKLDRGKQPFFLFAETERLGVYNVEGDDGASRGFAVNLLDGLESNLEPLPALHLGAQQVAAEGERATPRDLWKWIVLAGLALLVLEWFVYNKRVAL